LARVGPDRIISVTKNAITLSPFHLLKCISCWLMPITAQQIAVAEQVQHAAAHDASPQVRLIAGPGSGKSATIEERVNWLLGHRIPPAAICAVSFTRASSSDLRRRVHDFCVRRGHTGADQVRISTLHSLGLRLLRAAGQLAQYPVDPLVLDAWETENIFDSEFGHAFTLTKSRREAIRREHEAFWGTGLWAPPNYIPPTPAVTATERKNFVAFHGPRTQAYACVLPGEIVRQCVSLLEKGLIDPITLLRFQHLIVDEFQDLNPLDLMFVDHLIQRGVQVFVAGDDDQSIYSFRFAAPTGIQQFPATYAGTGVHELTACFRCTPTVLAAAMDLMAAHAAPGRIAKHQHSLYGGSTPPVAGVVHRWRFANATAEARAIAESCRDLIAADMNPREILILVSNQRALGPTLVQQLQQANVPFEHPREASFIDSDEGRLTLAMVRVICDREDYVSLRALLGLRRGVGIKTCHDICETVINNNLNFRDVFYNPIPAGIFATRPLKALDAVRGMCSTIATWSTTDTAASRSADIHNIIENHLDTDAASNWDSFFATLPTGINIEELRDYLWADTDEQQTAVIEAVFTRLGTNIPAAGVLPPRVRLMTMHGAKGLSARVVFIPGLEEEIFPGPWRRPFPGLVLEAARLLYVSITRARASCILTYSQGRLVNGVWSNQAPSRFTTNVGGAFTPRTNGLVAGEVSQIIAVCAQL
jgi:DNA helicase-2/ATP-dependent DNA helicase PcrA